MTDICHTCGHEFRFGDLYFRQHGVMVCNNLNCCWKKYQPPPGVHPNWKLSNLPSEVYKPKPVTKVNPEWEDAFKTAQFHANRFGFFDRLRLLFSKGKS